MNRLLSWLNIIIKKHRKLKRWQRIVTVLAAMITFVTTYALILPAITVEKDCAEEVGGMYLEQEEDEDDLLEENALEFTGVSIAAEQENAVTYEYADDDMTAVATFSTDEEIPEGAELVVNPVDTESEEYADLSRRASLLLDREFIYDVTTCSFFDYALICDGVDVTPKSGLVDVQINFLNNTVNHVEDVVYAGRFGRPAESAEGFVATAADITEETTDAYVGSAEDSALADPEDFLAAEDELVSANPDESSVLELTDGIITVLSLKGNDLAQNDSVVGILAGNVDEEAKEAAAETDAEVPTADDIPEESSAPEVKTLMAAGNDYIVTLTCDENSGVPEGATLAVSEIAQDTKEYKTYLEKTKKAMGLTEEETLPKYAARFFDIKIMAGNKEFKPESGVSVEITYAEPLAENPETEVSAVHFENKKAKAEVIEANASGVQEDGAASVEFTAESFSVYGVIYTVDFEYSVNGKMYQFSLPGGGFVSFTDLVEVLGIISDTNSEKNSAAIDSATQTVDGTLDVAVSEASKKFVADVASVEFSSPELVDVSKVENQTTVGQIKERRGLECEYSAELTEEQIADINAQTVKAGDWALISVQPFMSEESMTVTMKDGEVFTIRVTDAQIKKTVIDARGDTWEITVTYDEDAQIPDGAELNVHEIIESDERYLSYLVSSIDTMGCEGGVPFARFFDIEIKKGEEKIEPKAPVKVEIAYKDELKMDADDELHVVHFASDGIEDIDDVSISENGGTLITYEQSSFSVTGTLINGNNPQNNQNYVVILKKNNKYYVVLNDGSLEEVNLNGNSFMMDHPMVWTYQGDHISHQAFARTLDDSLKTASSWYYKYLDPSLEEGISNPTVGQIYFNSETPNEQLNIIDDENNAKRNQASLQFTGGKLRSTSAGNTNYYLGVDESTMHVIGKANVNEAAEVYFARADVNYNMSDYSSNRYANSCNHIDISVEAIAGVDVPLAYGDYYDEAGNLILSVSRENPVILKLSKKVDVTEDDIKNADLEAFIKDNEGRQTEVNNAYYVTGYSGNAPVEGSTAQVRVEGVFKVADWNQRDGDNAGRTGDVPRNHRIYYSLSTVKTETFEFKYNGISLYSSKDTAEPNREPLSITTDVTLSTSFDYWDEDNECPGIMEGWIPGGTPTQRWRDGWINATNLDGMDFVLGSQSESEPGVAAVEITKFIVDTDGNLISTTKETKTEMEIYLDRDGNPNSVKDLDVNRYTTPADYNGYVHIHDRTITVGQQGLGSIYDYAVDPGMIYIKEKPGSIEQELIDINDDKWVYHSTRIETEYVWRNNDGGVHVSDTYRVNGQNSSYASIPEVLGGYEFDGCTSPNYAANDGVQPYNGFLEFYVYNVYAPEDTDLTVSKIWKKGDTDIAAPADAEVKVFMKRYKLVPDEVYYDKGRLYIDKAFSGAEQDGFAAIYTVTNGERTWQLSYNDLPKTLTDLDPGTYTITEAVASDGAPAGFEAYHSDPVTVEVKGGQTATASFLTRYARSNIGRPATVQIYNDQYSHDVKYSNSVSYYAGDVLQISWVRSYNATIRYRVNNGEWVSMEKYPDNSGPEQRTDTFTVSIPENGILNIELDDSWTSIHNIEVTKAGGANRLSVRRLVGKAPVKAGSAVNTASFTNSNEAPVSNTSGMKYVVDESWPNVSSEYEYERNLAQNGIVLNNGHWSDDSLTGLPAYDANGRYIYAIDHIEETNLPEGTQVLFGKAEGSDLTVENHLPRDLSVTKAWNDGENLIPWPEDGPESIEIQLTRSTDGVNFEPAVNTQGITFTPVTITAADPVATFESLPYMDGNGKVYRYRASEVAIPDGYRPVTTVDSDGNVTITNTRMAVTVIKVDENNQPLPGAGFTLYKNTVNDAGKIEEKVADYRTTQFIFKNLTDGNYILHETTAPTGYSALAEDIRFTVSEKNIIVNNKPDNVLWDENSFVLTVKNMPLEGSLSVRKQWLDFFGNATEYNGTIDLKLVQWVPGEPKQHTVTFIVQCVGDGAVDGHGDVEFEGQVYELARRSGTGVGDVSLHWSWDQYTEDREVDVSGLQNSSYVQVSANGTQGKGGRTVTVTNIDRDLTVYIVIPNGGWKGTADGLIDQPIFDGNHPHEGDLTATGGTKTVTLGQNDIWTAQFNVSGDGLLSDASTTLPATYSQSGTAKPCYYSIAEEQIPEGYTLTQISTEKVQEGVLTAYNKKTSVDVTVVKTDKNRPAERLNGATFVLRQIDPAATGNMDTRMLAGGKSDTSTTAGEGAAKGTLTFPDLENGIYEIKETIAPDGYIMNGDSAFYIRVSAEGFALLQKDETTAAETWRTILNSSELSLQNGRITVTNEPGAALPSTGGPGTRLFTILGSILILGAGVLLWRRRRLI